MSRRMQLIKRRGQKRMKIRCHCRNEFWADFEEHKNVVAVESPGNPIVLAPQCPVCACVWDGQEPSEPIEPSPQPGKKGLFHFRLTVQVSADHHVVVDVGKARTLPEYMAKMAVQMPGECPGCSITTISQEDFARDKKALRKLRREQKREGPLGPMMTTAELDMPNQTNGIPPIYLAGKKPGKK